MFDIGSLYTNFLKEQKGKRHHLRKTKEGKQRRRPCGLVVVSGCQNLALCFCFCWAAHYLHSNWRNYPNTSETPSIGSWGKSLRSVFFSLQSNLALCWQERGFSCLGNNTSIVVACWVNVFCHVIRIDPFLPLIYKFGIRDENSIGHHWQISCICDGLLSIAGPRSQHPPSNQT